MMKLPLFVLSLLGILPALILADCAADYNNCLQAASIVRSQCQSNGATSCNLQAASSNAQCQMAQQNCNAAGGTNCAATYTSCQNALLLAYNSCNSGVSSSCGAAQNSADATCTTTYNTCVANQPSAANTPCYNINQDCISGYTIVVACCTNSGGTDCSALQSQYAQNCENAYAAAATQCSVGDDACCAALYQTETGISTNDAITYENSCQSQIQIQERSRIKMMSRSEKRAEKKRERRPSE